MSVSSAPVAHGSSEEEAGTLLEPARLLLERTEVPAVLLPGLDDAVTAEELLWSRDEAAELEEDAPDPMDVAALDAAPLEEEPGELVVMPVLLLPALSARDVDEPPWLLLETWPPTTAPSR